MADEKISELNALTTPDAADVFAIVDTSAAETKKISWSSIFTALAAVFGVPSATNGAVNHSATSTTTTVIAHGLGRTPVKIKFNYITGYLKFGFGNFDASGQHCVSGYGSTDCNDYPVAIAFDNDGGSNILKGTVTVDATNITITWAKTGSPTNTFTILWQCE